MITFSEISGVCCREYSPEHPKYPLNAALALAALGKPVFPCWNTPDDKDRHKTPMTPHGFYDATTNRSKIKRWWGKWPNALIGMRTGEASGVAVLDLDVKSGKDGYAAVPDWETRSPVIAKTGSGGAHLYFAAEGAPGCTHDAIALGVDTRGNLGYAIVPPSPGYTWINGHDLSSDLPPWPDDLRPLNIRVPRPEATTLPDWLLELMTTGPGGGLSNDPDDLPPVLTQAEAKAALSVIFDIGRSDWIAIGCALYKHFGDEVGFELWNNWSKENGGSNYKPHTIHKQWRSIAKKDGYDYNIGTLIYHANEADPLWRDNIERPEIDEPEPDAPGVAPDIPDADEPVQEAESNQDAKSEPKPDVNPQPDAGALIISNRNFVNNFVPPDYLIEGLLQRRFLYSCTALTHAGKTNVALRLAAHIIAGLSLGDREIEPGKVLFFAGENPDDVTMRWIKLCEEMKLTQETTDKMFWVSGVYSIKKMRRVIDAQTKKCGPFALIIIDTAAAYFGGAGGSEENDNTEYGNFARMLRTLVNIYGGPTILVNCHPIKNATQDNLIPRGGGAFLNEVDGNLVLKTITESPKVVDMHWQGKFRGPEFAPIPFAIIPGFSDQIKDSKGRPISTVYAKPLTAAERATAEDQGQTNQDRLLNAMKDHDGASLNELAEFCGWFYKSGDPNKSLVERTMRDLEARRLVKKEGGRWKLTKAGLAADTTSM
jgi:hypothetical protein